MLSKRRQTGKLFGTREVALIVDCPEWRVKNFMQPAYGLPPSQILGGGGRGSRRLYTYYDVKRVAIADVLVRCGFSPEAVGSGVSEVPQSLLAGRYEISLDKNLSKAELPMLVAQRGEWSLLKFSEVRRLLDACAAGGDTDWLPGDDLFVLNVVRVIHRMEWREMKLEDEGELPKWLLADEEMRRVYDESQTEVG